MSRLRLPAATILAAAGRHRGLLMATTLCVLVIMAWTAIPGAPISIGPCAHIDLTDAELKRAERIGSLGGSPDHSWLCVVYRPRTDAYSAVLFLAEPAGEFAATKILAARHLQAAGVDPCRVRWWINAAAHDNPTADDLLDNPMDCQALVIAADPGAERWLPEVRAALARVEAASWSELDWHPKRPLTIVVAADADAAAAIYRRYAIAWPPEAATDWTESRRRLAQRGASTFDTYTDVGSLLVINLSHKLRWDPSLEAVRASITSTVAHEYTHFAQYSIVGGVAIPAWFSEGQATYWTRQFMGGTYDSLTILARHGGIVPQLSQLAQDAVSLFDADLNPYDRGYAAVSYLVDRYGFPATVRLLQANRESSLERFDERLAALTGMDEDTLDDAVGVWLAAPGRVMLRDDFSNPSGHWPRSENARSKLGYEGDEYALVKRRRSGGSPVGLPIAPLNAYEAEVEARMMPPTEGTILRLQVAVSNYAGLYTYDVDPTRQTFALSFQVGEETTPVLDWQPAAAIHQGAAMNRLGVRATETEIVLRANDADLARVPVQQGAETALGGFLAITVDHRGDGEAEARFRRLVVTNAR